MRDMREMGDLLKEKERYPLCTMIKFGTTKFEVNYFFKMYTCYIYIYIYMYIVKKVFVA